jgi:tetratricopeptide (TPR) repeat protein
MADEPGSLAFLELAEALRRRGQLDAAHKVARGGLSRYPGLADAHDLVARILSDQGDLAGAFDAWASALQLDPMRVSALKGVGFLYFRAGETAAALDHLHRALEVDPDDVSIHQAIGRIVAPGVGAAGVASTGAASPVAASAPAREAAAPASASAASGLPAAWEPSEPAAPGPFEAVDDGERGLLLVDANGLRLGGRLADHPSDPAGDRVAAQLAGVSREAARATRLLGLGTWHTISVESPDGHVVLTPASADTVVVAVREPSLPMARVALLADRAARAARGWLEDQT